MTNPYQSDFRVSDEERSAAIENLGNHFADGRLELATYEERLDKATIAVTRSDLMALFADLPAMPSGAPSSTQNDKFYSANQISELHNQGKKIRAGILVITFIICVVLATAMKNSVIFMLVPLVWTLLYLMKVGPASWYVPSPRKLEKERIRQANLERLAQVREIEAQNALRVAEQKALRKQKQLELTNSAMSIANSTLQKFKSKRR